MVSLGGGMIALAVAKKILAFSKRTRFSDQFLLSTANRSDWPIGGVILGASGSVATVKIPEIVSKIISHGLRVDLVLTKSADFFLGVQYKKGNAMTSLKALQSLKTRTGCRMLRIWRDIDEWKDYGKVGDPVVHIDLVKQNKVLVVAPLSANTLASASLGLASNLLTSVIRAWHYDLDSSLENKAKPFIVAPSMNTYMWYQNITKQHLEVLKSRSVTVIEPLTKILACKDYGKGAMSSPDAIVNAVLKAFSA